MKRIQERRNADEWKRKERNKGRMENIRGRGIEKPENIII